MTITTFDARDATSFRLVGGMAPVATTHHWFLEPRWWWWQGRLGLAKAWRLNAWWKARGTYGFIYRIGEKIVALDRGAYPEKLGKWRGFRNRFTIGSFGIQAESWSVDWLGWVAVWVLFRYSTVWQWLLSKSSRVANKVMRRKGK
jgi:hypothetical protein